MKHFLDRPWDIAAMRNGQGHYAREEYYLNINRMPRSSEPQTEALPVRHW
jgi:hypothetical protein